MFVLFLQFDLIKARATQTETSTQCSTNMMPVNVWICLIIDEHFRGDLCIVNYTLTAWSYIFYQQGAHITGWRAFSRAKLRPVTHFRCAHLSWYTGRVKPWKEKVFHFARWGTSWVLFQINVFGLQRWHWDKTTRLLSASMCRWLAEVCVLDQITTLAKKIVTAKKFMRLVYSSIMWYHVISHEYFGCNDFFWPG